MHAFILCRKTDGLRLMGVIGMTETKEIGENCNGKNVFPAVRKG